VQTKGRTDHKAANVVPLRNGIVYLPRMLCVETDLRVKQKHSITRWNKLVKQWRVKYLMQITSLYLSYTNTWGNDMLQFNGESFLSRLIAFNSFIPLSPSLLSPAFLFHHNNLPVPLVSSLITQLLTAHSCDKVPVHTAWLGKRGNWLFTHWMHPYFSGHLLASRQDNGLSFRLSKLNPWSYTGSSAGTLKLSPC
jgi:hypothetical protein